MTYAIYVIVFYVGLFIGWLLHRWLGHRSSYSGVISVIDRADKTLYSLELEEDPELLAYKDEVIFRVVTFKEVSEENGDRG